LYTHKKYPNYNYYKKIIDINLLNNNRLIKPNILEGSIISNKLEMDISNLYLNLSYTTYQRLMMFIMNIYNKISDIMVNINIYYFKNWQKNFFKFKLVLINLERKNII